jgi:hypothetical protein
MGRLIGGGYPAHHYHLAKWSVWCDFFEVMQQTKSVRPCLPIFLDDGMETCMLSEAVYSDGCIETISWAVIHVVKYC